MAATPTTTKLGPDQAQLRNLMRRLADATSTDAPILSVYVDNHRAHRFYQRYGFTEIGRYVFMVGEKADDDRILRLAL